MHCKGRKRPLRRIAIRVLTSRASFVLLFLTAQISAATLAEDFKAVLAGTTNSLGGPANELPATDLSQDVAQAQVRAISAAPGFSHAGIPDNPLALDAKPVGEKVCVACHELENQHFSHTLHADGLRAAASTTMGAPVCEACHGPGSLHAKHPNNKGMIIGFTKNSGTTIALQAKTCLNCHSGGARDHWAGSVHQRNDLSCSDCHNPMQKSSVEGLLTKNSINETCATCHRDIRVQFNRRSHMPLPEGQMACVDCHNPHGSLTAPLLKTNTVNETCYQCHAEKRGPFLFEHAPVRENCLNCHSPHGSNQASLLVAPIPFLCQQCHVNNRHPNDQLNAQSLGSGLHPDERIMGRGCITCHAQIHGSNSPSGPKLHE